jgi:hypothetical protein
MMKVELWINHALNFCSNLTNECGICDDGRGEKSENINNYA